MGEGNLQAGVEHLNSLARLLTQVDAATQKVTKELRPSGETGHSREEPPPPPRRVSGEPFAHAALDAFHRLGGLPIKAKKVHKSGTPSRMLAAPSRELVLATYDVLRERISMMPAWSRLQNYPELDPSPDTVDKWCRSYRKGIA